MQKRPWDDFSNLRSQSFVRDMMGDARNIPALDLMDMREYRKAERIAACSGHDPLQTLVAYAQDEIIYDDNGNIVKEPVRAQYIATLRRQRLNKFGLAYRPDAKLYLHKTLADIVIGAAIHLHQSQSWTTTLYDGLRTMEGAYNLYLYAPEADITGGLLALPGQSAHNKGLAVDSMMYDANGHEIDMGGHFDHLDMTTNSRTFTARDTIQKNRLIREAAFLRSAFAQGLLVAPLRTEFWDDRLPENREDLWRVLDSAARCIGIKLLSDEDEIMRRENRAAFSKKWERWNYAEFLERWHDTFKGHEKDLLIQFAGGPPPTEKPEFYHGNYHPIYDRDLRASGKHLTDVSS